MSTYQMMPSPSRLATWNIRRGTGKEAPWFSLRQIRYSAASTRANQTPNEEVGASGISLSGAQLAARKRQDRYGNMIALLQRRFSALQTRLLRAPDSMHHR